MEILGVLKIALAIVGVLLVIVIVLQNRSGGLGTVFGGSGGGEFYRSKRGMEAFLYNSTIILAIAFTIISIAIAVIS